MSQTPEDFLSGLDQIDWFSAVGEELIISHGVSAVHTWNEAFGCAEHPVSWWCNVEGKKLLYESLAKTHYSRFSQWNSIAREFLPRIVEILETVIVPRASVDDFPKKARGWVQSQIVGAVMEISYSDCISVTIFQDQIDLYRKGHFACGWQVTRPDQFPHDSIVNVF